MIPLLDEHEVRRHLPMADLVPAVARALADLSAGRAEQPVRTMLPVGSRGFFAAMPAYAGALGAKLVTYFPVNQDRPTHHALIVLFRPETGEPMAVMDGRLITEMRTAAASAVATDLLARRDAAVLALLGSGVQAGSHLEALRLVRRFTEVRVWRPRAGRAFAERHGIVAAGSAEAAVRGADVVVVATSSRVPVLRGRWLAPGAHVNAVGACRPDWRELDDELIRRARLYVDSAAAATLEAGDVIAAGGPFAELGEVVLGTRPGRQEPQELTLFKSVGVAVEDLAAADLVYRRSRGLPPDLPAVSGSPDAPTA
jgi:ornithine cyclodeaminase/alanine dehydrogenase-like protein (mu-crystallin family)